MAETFGDVNRELKRIDKRFGDVDGELVRLRRRIAQQSGDSGADFYVSTGGESLITAGNGLTGGGLLPGNVTLAVAAGDGLTFSSGSLIVDLHDTWSGLEFSSGEMRINTSAVFAWGADHAWDTDTLYVDVSEHKIYINSGTLPTYRGALTVSPNVYSERGLVILGQASQTGNLLEVRDSVNALKTKVTADGNMESGTFTSGLTGWQVNHEGDAEFNSIVARGEFRASVFTIGEMHADGGTLMVLEASTLYEGVTTS